MHSIVRPVAIGRPSFLDAARCTALDLLDADIAILGMPFTTPDDVTRWRSPSSDAPDAVRRQSARLAGVLTEYDFDLGGSLFDGRNVSIADCGDVWGEPGEFERYSRVATSVVERVRNAGALPIVLGGDQAALLPTLRAYADQASLCVVHIGAELRWHDEIGGGCAGARTVMRRASELRWVTSMVHFGLRGVGSARERDVEDALGFGSDLIRAQEIHERGVEAVLRRVPRPATYYICLDADGLDPSIAPGVELPAFGGLSYFEVSNLLMGLVTRGPVVGLALVGIVPAQDVNDITSLLGARLILNVLSRMVRVGGLHTRGSNYSSVAVLVRK